MKKTNRRIPMTTVKVCGLRSDDLLCLIVSS